MKVHGLMLGSEDPKKLAEFYEKVLGKPAYEDGDWYGWGDNSWSLMLGPHSEVKGKSANPQRIMIQLESSDVAADFAHIKSCGGETIAEPYQPDPENNPRVWLATLADVDGNYIQLATPWEEN